MNILFLSLIDFDSISEKGIYTDLLTELQQMGHEIYAVSPFERRKGGKERVIRENDHVSILKVMIGNTQKTNLIEKGISTVTIEPLLIRAIERYFGNVSFDLILYATPPITFERVIRHVKKKNGNAVSYLMLKDIFPQNAVDLGMFSKDSPMYLYFRRKEKRLYEVSDYIGCMSPENCRYLLRHNPEICKERVEVCPNSIKLDDGKADKNGITKADVEKADRNGINKADNGKADKNGNTKLGVEKADKHSGTPADTGLDVKMLVSRAERESLRKRLREAYGLPTDRAVFLYGGNLGKPQDIPFLIRCLKENKGKSDRFFLICGSGTEYERLHSYYESIKADEDCNIKLLKELPKEEYEQLPKICDAGLIFLDHRFTIPNFPSRILSYMEAGIPVLAATDRHTDMKNVILKGQFGDWCESVSASDFTQMLDRFIADPDRRKICGENARKFLERHFTTRQTAEKILGRL